MASKLTAVVVRDVKPDPSKRREIPDDGCRGLYLVVQPSGARSWALRYRRPGDGKPAKLALGPVRDLQKGEQEPINPPEIGAPLTLAQAHRLAADQRALVAGRQDPGELKKARKRAAEAEDRLRAASVFEVVAVEFIERYAKVENREASWRETARLLGFRPDDQNPTELVRRAAPEGVFGGVVKHWAGRPVHDITKAEVIKLLDAIRAGGAPYSANRVLALLKTLFTRLVARDVLTTSPCAGIEPWGGEIKRDRVLDDEELALVWRAAARLGYPFGPFVQVLILTGQRRDEVAEMRWGEIDYKAALWSLPGARVKNSRPHQVPLSDQAAAALAAAEKIAGKPDFVFTSGERAVKDGKVNQRALAPISGFSKAKARLDSEILKLQREDATKAQEDPQGMQALEPWRFHDLRRTFATGLARLKIPVHVTEAVLNHKTGTISGVAAVYNRYDYADEKRAALAAWGAYVERLTSATPSGNVIEIAGKRR
ncbi:tyrosine-type recombinase/integrase [Phenylobacterium sp.]|uniref:tyrosine-type recombinase/integrase n=1 Tax=Phenylobacterium sp. TaxID=1871053 RepID=UPI00356AB626